MNDKQQCDLLAESLMLELTRKLIATAPRDPQYTLQLGMMGHECERNLWYRFRHTVAEEIKPLRVLQNEHTHLLREMIMHIITANGVVSWAKTNVANTHFKIINNHFAGHAQAIINTRINDQYEDMPLFIHISGTGAKFNEIVGAGVERARPDQYAQLCVQLRELQLIHALYIAYNKNDESIYMEVVPVDVETAQKVVKRAESVIYATEPPPRINESPSWYVCKSCPANNICHPEPGGPNPAPKRNCLSCKNAYPFPNGEWQCRFYNAIIPVTFREIGCSDGYQALEI